MRQHGIARLTASSAVLLVRDVRKAADHYRDAMGFAYERFWGEPPSFVILARDGMYLMLKQAADPKHVIPRWTVSDYGPCDQPYGCREFGTQDLDGHDLGFGQVIK